MSYLGGTDFGLQLNMAALPGVLSIVVSPAGGNRGADGSPLRESDPTYGFQSF